jgi:hypothetical protein
LIGGAPVGCRLIEQVLPMTFKAATALLFSSVGKFSRMLAIDGCAAVGGSIFHGKCISATVSRTLARYPQHFQPFI